MLRATMRYYLRLVRTHHRMPDYQPSAAEILIKLTGIGENASRDDKNGNHWISGRSRTLRINGSENIALNDALKLLAKLYVRYDLDAELKEMRAP